MLALIQLPITFPPPFSTSNADKARLTYYLRWIAKIHPVFTRRAT
jgi:hypothetical protein